MFHELLKSMVFRQYPPFLSPQVYPVELGRRFHHDKEEVHNIDHTIAVESPSAMKRRHFLASTLAATTGLARQSRALEAKPRQLLAREGLEGWAVTDFHASGKVNVKEGVLSLKRGKPMTGVTCKLLDLPKTDYELTYEARRTDGDDFFAAATFPVKDGFLTFVTGGWSGNVTGLSSIDGADASENETNKLVKFENDTWYKIRIRVEGEKITCHVNNDKVVDFDGTGRQLKTRVESRPSQPLGFACYDSESEIRNIQVQPL